MIFFKHFRCNITKGAEGFVRIFIWTNDFCKAKINEFWYCSLAGITHHNILKLQISVHDAKRVQILKCQSNLVDELLDSFFFELISTHRYVLEHVLALHVFKYHVVVVISLKQV